MYGGGGADIKCDNYHQDQVSEICHNFVELDVKMSILNF